MGLQTWVAGNAAMSGGLHPHDATVQWGVLCPDEGVWVPVRVWEAWHLHAHTLQEEGRGMQQRVGLPVQWWRGCSHGNTGQWGSGGVTVSMKPSGLTGEASRTRGP